VLLVDKRCFVQQKNAAAEQLFLQLDCPLRLRNRQLTAIRASDDAALQRAVSLVVNPEEIVAAPPNILTFGGPAGVASVSLMAAPTRQSDFLKAISCEPMALIFIAQPEDNARGPDHVLLMRHFGLSAAEAAVAANLTKGIPLDEIASQREVSRETIRVQVKSLFTKLDVRSQGQVIGRIFRSLAMLRGPSA
jgi:DNA-binding CsgD family transcriptional regulator